MSRSGMTSIHPRAARISCRGPLLPPPENTARRLIHSGDAMYRVGAHIGLSPSDLNDHIECPHLTTLALEVARAEKPTYVLQLCFYSDGIAAIQGMAPERMHVLIGIGEQRALRYDDFAAYYRRVRARFEAAIATPQATEPYRVDHCSLCQFRGVCAARWDAEDHLVRVAGVRRDQVMRLRAGGIPTLAALAAAPTTPVVDVAQHTFDRLRDQAN